MAAPGEFVPEISRPWNGGGAGRPPGSGTDPSLPAADSYRCTRITRLCLAQALGPGVYEPQEVTVATYPSAQADVSITIDAREHDDDEDEEDSEEEVGAAEEAQDQDQAHLLPSWYPRMLGYQGEYGIRRFSARIHSAGKPAGTLSATLVNRPGPFYFACDAESDDLCSIGELLFDPRGVPIYPPLQDDLDCRHGGFLYINDLLIRDDFSEASALAFAMVAHPRLGQMASPLLRDLQPELIKNIVGLNRIGPHDCVGAAALRCLLTHPELDLRWSVAAYACEGWAAGPHSTTAFAARDGRRRRMAADALKFVRAGFREVQRRDGQYFFVTKTLLGTPPLTHMQALAVPLLLNGAPPSESFVASADEVDSEEDVW